MKRQHIAATVLLVASSAVIVRLAAEEKLSLKSANGVGFSEFRGYETWQTIAPSGPEGGLKVIVGNPTAIRAFQEGIPVNGKAFPDGSMMAKIEWTKKDNPLLPGAAAVPDNLKQVGFMVKDSKRFTDTNGWGYAEFEYDPAAKSFKALGGEDGSFAKTTCHKCHTVVSSADFVFTRYAAR